MTSPVIELSVIAPTFNEAGNVEELVEKLEATLQGIAFEIIFVDDNSPDGTAEKAKSLARHKCHVRCIKRIGRRGLSSACIEGIESSSAPYVAVMDADLQHDETLLPQMLERLKGGGLDIVVGSRYVHGGGIGDWDSSRAFLSRLATRLSKAVIRVDLKDPMSGFFMLKREVFSAMEERLSGIGFKILVDLFASSKEPLAFEELPFEFRQRREGVSKMDTLSMWDYVLLLLDKLLGGMIPARFISFSLVGGFGVFVHLAILTVTFKWMAVLFVYSQAIATLLTMCVNFALNNILTYQDKRLHGWHWFTGLLSFIFICSIGAVANVGIAAFLFDRKTDWIVAAVAGILVGSVWNYAVTSFYTWKSKG